MSKWIRVVRMCVSKLRGESLSSLRASDILFWILKTRLICESRHAITCTTDWWNVSSFMYSPERKTSFLNVSLLSLPSTNDDRMRVTSGIILHILLEQQLWWWCCLSLVKPIIERWFWNALSFFSLLYLSTAADMLFLIYHSLMSFSLNFLERQGRKRYFMVKDVILISPFAPDYVNVSPNSGWNPDSTKTHSVRHAMGSTHWLPGIRCDISVTCGIWRR